MRGPYHSVTAHCVWHSLDAANTEMVGQNVDCSVKGDQIMNTASYLIQP